MSETTMTDLFGDNIIYEYSRQEALEDGVLVDVTETAQELGFLYPVAVTQAVQGLIDNIPPAKQVYQTPAGRLWDILSIARIAIKTAIDKKVSIIHFQVLLAVGRKKKFTFKIVCGPGDAMEPVLTIMLPDED